ncbi:MAG: hybrid sensor histidine kinase/response regulator, partial [Sphingomonadales bacterium]|nr:hybrid sensor histidine kinase/response regulator [Sphingomonadales bacterium]
MDLKSAALLVLTLVLVQFAIAAFVEARGERLERRVRLRHGAYALALGVYCTSWTFYGAVGTAVREGWNYLPIYVAPIMVLLFAPRFLRKLTQAVADEQATTVSDFIAARFGHDVIVARLVTVIALAGSIPYVALQLRSIGTAMALVSGQRVGVPVMMLAALLLALFAVLYGARRYELAGRSEGLVYATGLDSLLKLAALTAVALLALSILGRENPHLVDRSVAQLKEGFRPEHLSLDTAVIALLSAFAIIALPRQFYMGLVEARAPGDLVRARFGLSAYIAVMAALALPIALAGVSLFGPAIAPDRYVLQLPIVAGSSTVLAAALLGGVSAAASMAIVDTTALATMVSNDLVFPTVLRSEAAPQEGGIGRRMLQVRRVSILGIMLLALSWAMMVSPRNSLASIGLIAFAAMAQFSPHLLL